MLMGLRVMVMVVVGKRRHYESNNFELLKPFLALFNGDRPSSNPSMMRLR